MNAHAKRFDLFAQHGRAVVVELYRHQVWRKLHDVRFQAQLFQGIRGFQSQQATANDHPATGLLCLRGDVIQVVQRTVNKAARQRAARYRRHKRVRAGRQHQFVPVGFMPTGGTHDVCVAIDTHNLLREAKLNAVFSKEITVHQRERFCASSAKIF